MSNYLIHYGVKGMKWGVRKYNPYDSNAYKYNKSIYGAHRAKKIDRNIAKGYSRRRARTAALYGEKASNNIERRVRKGSTVFKAELIEAGKKAVKDSLLITSAVTVAFIAVNPTARKIASYGARRTANKLKSVGNYVVKQRYNKGSQIASPKYIDGVFEIVDEKIIR